MLIKFVIQAIPTYSMSCFKLPKSLIKEIEVLICKFWWGYNGDSRKFHWLKWEKLCVAKEVGSLGFKEIKKSNMALLAKQVWRMLENLDSLCYKVFKACFFLDCSILDAKESALGSYAWKCILIAREVIEQGMVWRTGDGRSVCIKEDKWLLGPVARSVSSPLPDIPPDAKDHSRIDVDEHKQRAELIQELFLPHEAQMILSIPLSIRLPQDHII